jgi:hypothetical protein
MKKTLITLSLFALTTVTFAHEGHDQVPGATKSLHGGTVQSGKQLNLEVIVTSNTLTLYPTGHDGKDIAAKDVKIEVIANPKKGKAFPVKLEQSKGAYTAIVDLQGANRLPITVNVTNQGKTDHFIVQVEE